MFTVKLYGNSSLTTQSNENENIRIVKGNAVDINKLGRSAIEIIVYDDEGRGESYFILPKGNKPHDKILEKLPTNGKYWYEAYIENSNGATTEIVRI